ncbi:MAG TPA: DUF5926 family protein [Actinomycetales bacterium]|nr:DUF5926 family protein [Actinomycetales bacterium]
MGKSSRRRATPARSSAAGSAATVRDADVPVVGQREPCPCGSGQRYKACHGRLRQQAPQHVARPFAGLPGEVDWVALREIVPAATATVRLRAAADLPTSDSSAPPEITVATVLPMAWPALRRADGQVLVGLQNAGGGSADPSRDVGAALSAAVAAQPGTPVTSVPGGEVPRLQDLLDVDVPFDVTVHDGFDFWVEGADDLSTDVQASLERANASVVPTARLSSVDGAYWAQVGDRTHLRWVLPQDEDALLDALARLHAAGATALGEGTRYIGAFRAHGLLVPVWDLTPGATADDVEGPAKAFGDRLDEALDRSEPLTYDERRARAGVVSRQLTLR